MNISCVLYFLATGIVELLRLMFLNSQNSFLCLCVGDVCLDLLQKLTLVTLYCQDSFSVDAVLSV